MKRILIGFVAIAGLFLMSALIMVALHPERLQLVAIELEKAHGKKTQLPSGKVLPPSPEHVPNGDYVDDAVAYSKKLIPFMRNHVVPGRTHAEQCMAVSYVVYKAARDLGYGKDRDTLGQDFAFIGVVNEKLEDVGIKVLEDWKNQPFLAL
jgi:hypothetical protein